MKTANKKATAKKLQAQADAIRAEWRVRGVAEGEFEQVKALENQVWELSDRTGSTVDSLYR